MPVLHTTNLDKRGLDVDFSTNISLPPFWLFPDHLLFNTTGHFVTTCYFISPAISWSPIFPRHGHLLKVPAASSVPEFAIPVMESGHDRKRITALIASLFVSLVAGTPYLYGVYSPQLVQKVNLLTSDAATISVAVNIGSGLGGLPAGLLIDHIGPLKSILLGSLAIFIGYFSLSRIYVYEISSLMWICILMVFVGIGSVTSFFASLKAAQANFPNHRGSAAAIPVGAYGLAATIFSIVATTFFNGTPGRLLLFLALFCGPIAFFGSFFVNIYPTNPSSAKVSDSNLFKDLRGSISAWGVGKRTPRSSMEALSPELESVVDQLRTLNMNHPHQDSTLYLLTVDTVASKVSSLDEGSPLNYQNFEDCYSSSWHPGERKPSNPLRSITYLITNKLFLTHFVIISLCSGVCQTYIYTVGFIVQAQFNSNYLTSSQTPAAFQAIQVSVLSVSSFGGRVTAGLLSDHIHKNLKSQRQWVIIGTILLAFFSQLLLIMANGIQAITMISILVGCGYGLLNGTYPAIIADEFGTDVFTTAWGLTCSGPLVVLFSLESLFGSLYDRRSDENGLCHLGNFCYAATFEMSACLLVIAIFITMLLMYVKRKR